MTDDAQYARCPGPLLICNSALEKQAKMDGWMATAQGSTRGRTLFLHSVPTLKQNRVLIYGCLYVFACLQQGGGKRVCQEYVLECIIIIQLGALVRWWWCVWFAVFICACKLHERFDKWMVCAPNDTAV